MRIFIDTNIIFKADFFRSVTAQNFLKATKFLEIEVLIPEVVIDEIKGNFSQELPDRLAKYKKLHQSLSELIDTDEVEINVNEEIEIYKNWLDNLLEEHEVTILPYPTTSTKEIITESYKKKRPFKENGEGHKDYLIWETIKNYVSEKPDDPQTFFLTDNIKDFCQKKSEDEYTIHTDISSQIPKGKTVPEVYRSFKKFFDEKIATQLQNVELEHLHGLTQTELYEHVGTIVERKLADYAAYGFEGLSFCNDVTVISASEVTPNSIESKEINKDDIMITIRGTVLIEVHGFIDKFNYYSTVEHEEAGHIDVLDGDWNDHVMLVSQTTITPFEVNITYSKKENTTIDEDVQFPDEIMDDLYY